MMEYNEFDEMPKMG